MHKSNKVFNTNITGSTFFRVFITKFITNLIGSAYCRVFISKILFLTQI